MWLITVNIVQFFHEFCNDASSCVYTIRYSFLFINPRKHAILNCLKILLLFFLRNHEHFPKNINVFQKSKKRRIYLCENLTTLICRGLFCEMSCIIAQFLVYFTVIWIMSATEGSNQDKDAFNCHVCGAGNAKKCAGCHSIAYCGKDCQVKHWKAGHKNLCRQLQARRYISCVYICALFIPRSLLSLHAWCIILSCFCFLP